MTRLFNKCLPTAMGMLTRVMIIITMHEMVICIIVLLKLIRNLIWNQIEKKLTKAAGCFQQQLPVKTFFELKSLLIVLSACLYYASNCECSLKISTNDFCIYVIQICPRLDFWIPNPIPMTDVKMCSIYSFVTKAKLM